MPRLTALENAKNKVLELTGQLSNATSAHRRTLDELQKLKQNDEEAASVLRRLQSSANYMTADLTRAAELGINLDFETGTNTNGETVLLISGARIVKT